MSPDFDRYKGVEIEKIRGKQRSEERSVHAAVAFSVASIMQGAFAHGVNQIIQLITDNEAYKTLMLTMKLT
ncbi:hypothetical protein CF651_26285 [Paenibacillus rigui]|uniref:Uncharacterized protein n=1 Tax=Paenibacillus rigui TaxID=554312 RepID=A0A229UIP9_9BACL|nr:hypothetical protein CF651_26285 [Paenibacillus rigui]